MTDFEALYGISALTAADDHIWKDSEMKKICVKTIR